METGWQRYGSHTGSNGGWHETAEVEFPGGGGGGVRREDCETKQTSARTVAV